MAALNYVELMHVFATSTCALDSYLNAEVRLLFGCPHLLPETPCSDMCSSRNLADFLLLRPVRHTALLLEHAGTQGIRKKELSTFQLHPWRCLFGISGQCLLRTYGSENHIRKTKLATHFVR